MSQFTCISCRVAFASADIQRQHYKTDWHRYNLKRKVVNFVPVTAEEFQIRVIQQRQKDAEEAEDTARYCKICRKVFGSIKAFENHLGSKKHRDGVSGLGEEATKIDVISEPRKKKEVEEEDDIETDSEVETIDSDWDSDEPHEDNPIVLNNCLFCSHHSASMTKNLKHMSIEHSFFVPDIEYVTGLRPLLLYLGDKVTRYSLCLWCNAGRTFHSPEAAKAHMRAKGHCKILYEGATLAEFERFYNYAESYPDHDDDMDIDEEIDLPTVDDSDFQLTLPSGSTIGHRSLFVYYKQSFGNTPAPPARKLNKLNKVLAGYKALGWTATDKIAAAKNAKDIRYMRAVQNKYFMKLGVKSNKLQKHFRPQVDF